MFAAAHRSFKDIKRELLDNFERRYLFHLLEQHRFDLSAVERSSGLSRRHLYALINKHGFHEQLVRYQTTPTDNHRKDLP